MTMQWRGAETVDRNLADYAVRVRFALREIAAYWTPQIETSAKMDAAWIDQTGNARAGLKCEYNLLSHDEVAEIVLHHSVDYGLALETRWAGRYAIIWPTLSALAPQVHRMVRGVFGK